VSDQPTRQLKQLRKQTSSESKRQPATGLTAQSSAHRAWFRPVRRFFGWLFGLSLWKPLKFVGHYIMPPYFRNSWRELKLVTWPNRKQSRQLTFAVIMFSVVLGVFVALLDLGFGKLFKEVIVK
jgi:preprotein translocase SecE subunit